MLIVSPKQTLFSYHVVSIAIHSDQLKQQQETS